MLVFRRTVAVILAIVFVFVFISTLLVFRVNDTAGNPKFYVDQLRKGDVYNFAYHEALPTVLDGMATSDTTNSSFKISNYKSNLTAFAEQAIPPSYVQAQVENGITTVLPYFLGDTNTFSLQIPIKERVETTIVAIRAQINQPGFFAGIYDQLIDQLTRQISAVAGLPPGLSGADLEAAMRQTAPPDWLQKQVNNALDQIEPYMTKENDHFTIAIKIDDRLDALQSTLTNVLKSKASYDIMIQTIVDMVTKQNLLETAKLPTGVTFSDQELRQIVQSALPLDWYQKLAAEMVSQIFDYLKGNKATLNISVSLADRKPQIETAIINAAAAKMAAYIDSLPAATPDQTKQLLLNPPTNQIPTFRPAGLTYKLQGNVFGVAVNVSQWLPAIQTDMVDALNQQSAYDRLIGQLQAQTNSQGTQTLPMGISFSSNDFNTAVSQAMPITWYRTVTTGLARQVTSYLNGVSANSSVSMSLVDRKPVLASALAAIADKNMQAYISSLPAASTPEQLAWWVNPPKGQLPASIPAGITYDQIKSTLGIDFFQQTQTLVNSIMPDQWTLSQSDIAAALGSSSPTFLTDARTLVRTGIRLDTNLGSYVTPPDTLALTQNDFNSLLGSPDVVTKMRDYVKNGISITDTDLKNKLGEDTAGLETARNYIAGGFVFTNTDFEKLIAGQSGSQSVTDFNNLRQELGTARKWMMLLWILLALLLIAIGFLGGRRWSSRLMWAASVLAVTGLIVWLVSAPVYTSIVGPQMHSKLANGFGQGTTALDTLLGNKVATMAEDALNTFVSGLSSQALITLLISLVLLGTGITLYVLEKRKIAAGKEPQAANQ